MKNADIEMLEKYKKRVKAQNEAAKKNWDTVSCRLPKGTKDRIKALGLTVNGVINDSVLSFLEQEENERNTELERLEAQEVQQARPDEGYQDKLQNNNNSTNPITLAEAQAILDRKIAEQKEQKEMLEKAKQERIEQEESERRAEINNIIDRIISGEAPENNSAKK